MSDPKTNYHQMCQKPIKLTIKLSTHVMQGGVHLNIVSEWPEKLDDGGSGFLDWVTTFNSN